MQIFPQFQNFDSYSWWKSAVLDVTFEFLSLTVQEFCYCDTAGENQLDLEGFSKCFAKLGLTYDKAELLELMQTADADNTGSISFEEFQSLFDAANLRKVFDHGNQI